MGAAPESAAGDEPTRAARIDWLRANAAPIRSIDPADTDFSDLDALARAIGDARVVMLGEQAHGDGATFRAKARLVRFLHERMGFDVLAFESGLYDMRKAWADVRSGAHARTAARRAVFGIWSMSREAQPVFDYVSLRARSEQPLELAGFDCQFLPVEGSFARNFLIADLAAFLRSYGVETDSVAEWPRFRTLLEQLVADSNLYRWKPPVDDQRFVLAIFDDLSARVSAAQGGDAIFWRQLLKSTKAQAQAHFHEIFNIGFTSYDGASAWVGAKPVPLVAPPAGSLEDLWAATSQQAAFLDLRRPSAGGEWLRSPLWSRPLGHNEGTATDWTRILDAMVFIRTMQPSTMAA